MSEYKIMQNEEEIVEYEKGLYHAFMIRDPDGWVANNYKVINGNRLRSKSLSYSDLDVFAAKENDNIIAASSVNYNMNKKLQLEEMVFKIEKRSDVCEGLIFFTTEEIVGEQFLEISGKLFTFALDLGRKKGIKVVYGTCSRKLKAMYTLIGWEVVDRINIDGLKKLTKLKTLILSSNKISNIENLDNLINLESIH